MLLIKTFIAESTIPGIGLGLFADEDIPKDKVIWRFNPLLDKLLYVKDFQYLHDIEQEFVKIYSYREGQQLIICCDNDRYINHSKTLKNIDDHIETILGSVSRSNRDIKRGEELFCDYTTFDDDSRETNKINNYK